MKSGEVPLTGTFRATVKIRRNLGQQVKESAEQIDGKTYDFTYGWLMDEDDPYPGEFAFIPKDDSYPEDAPSWIASGDLEFRLPVTRDSETPWRWMDADALEARYPTS